MISQQFDHILAYITDYMDYIIYYIMDSAYI